MTDKEEFAVRSPLKWTREGDTWMLLYRRRRMGRFFISPSGSYSSLPVGVEAEEHQYCVRDRSPTASALRTIGDE